MTLRVATASDLAAIKSIDPWVIEHEGARERFLRALEAGAVIVAEDEGNVAGYLAMEFGFYGHTFVAFLSVEPGKRRRGIASTLLRETEGHARKGKVFASTSEFNVAMQNVFDRNGWRRVGSLASINDEELAGDQLELIYVKAALSRDVGRTPR